MVVCGRHYLFKDAVKSYLDVRRCVGNCLKHPGLARKGREGPRTNLGRRNLSHPRVEHGRDGGGRGLIKGECKERGCKSWEATIRRDQPGQVDVVKYWSLPCPCARDFMLRG